MAYSITTYAGAPVATVQDATVNTSATNLTLIGRDYAGYGAFLNENFVYLLNNFARSVAPGGNSGEAQPLNGQLWYNPSSHTLNVYDSDLNGWKPISGAISQGAAPVNSISTVGDIFWNTNTNQLFVFSGNTNGWILIGPTTTGNTSASGSIVSTIVDATETSHVAINFYINNQIVGIMSFDPTYTPYTAINGFATINPGLNLSSSSTTANTLYQFTGTTTNSLALNGLASDQFLRGDQNATTSYQLTAGGGYVVANDLTIALDAHNNQVVINSTTNGRNLNFYANVSGQTTNSISVNGTTGTVAFADAVTVGGSLSSTGALTVASTTNLQGITTLQSPIVPLIANTIDIGNTASRFGNVWATTLYGNLVGNLSQITGLTVAGGITASGASNIANVLTVNLLTVNGSSTYNGNVVVANVYTPNSAAGGNTSVGSTGQITYDSNYIYVCVAPNVWKRAAISLW